MEGKMYGLKKGVLMEGRVCYENEDCVKKRKGV